MIFYSFYLEVEAIIIFSILGNWMTLTLQGFLRKLTNEMTFTIWKSLQILSQVRSKNLLLSSIKQCSKAGLFEIHTDLKPACWMDENGNIHGIFKDALEIASKSLNLTLKFKQTLPQNTNTWFIKYYTIIFLFPYSFEIPRYFLLFC